MKIFMFFLLFFASPPLFAQATFKVMTYNVENFFDTRDNPTKNDDEFLPSGNRYWTQSRYYHKLTNSESNKRCRGMEHTGLNSSLRSRE